MISRSVVPIGTSTDVLLIFRPSKHFRAFDFPCRWMHTIAHVQNNFRTFAYVSTLFNTSVAEKYPHWQETADGDGSPRIPSIEFINAVSSPHTKAPHRF
jgi:hypothetical protein